MTAAFCGGCGRPLPEGAPCSSCGADNPAGQRFCNQCGTLLAERLPVPQVDKAVEAAQPQAARAAPYPTRRPPAIETAPPSPHVPHYSAPIFVAVTLAFAVAVFVRFFKLGSIPPDLHSAEAAFRQTALMVIDQGWIGVLSETTNGQPTGFSYLIGGWVHLFGAGTASLRLVPALVGLAGVGAFYFFCRSLFGGRAAVLGSLLMALSVWHLSYSRLATPVNALPLVELVTACLLLSALSEKVDLARQRRLLVLAGLAFGAGVYFYNAFFIFAVVVALLWAREFLAGEYPVGVVWRRCLMFLIPALILAFPYLGFLAANPGKIVEQARAVALSSTPEYQELPGVTEQSRHALANIVRSARVLLWSRSGEEAEGETHSRLLDPVTALLTVLGLLVGLWRWRERRHFFLWAMIATTVVAVGLTREPGMPGRLIVALPAVFASAGLALDWLLAWMKGRMTQKATYAFVAVLVAFVAFHNLSSHFRRPLGLHDDLGVCSVQSEAPAVVEATCGARTVVPVEAIVICEERRRVSDRIGRTHSPLLPALERPELEGRRLPDSRAGPQIAQVGGEWMWMARG